MGWSTGVYSLVLIGAAAAGCGDDGFSCDDPKYGNGTCDLDTTCGAPDIDCFETFDTPEAARSWYDANAATLAPSLPPSDSRFAATQALIDEGWEAYKALHNVGKLGEKHPQLVLLDDPAINAFVLTPKLAGLAVMVNRGLVDSDGTKAQKLGIMMHEFEHAAALHGIPEVKDRIRKFYATPATSELLGYAQPDDAAVRAVFAQWSKYAGYAGVASDVELAGMPISNGTLNGDTLGRWGAMGMYFRTLVVSRASAVNTAACTNAVMQFASLNDAALMTTTVVDGAFHLNSTAGTQFATAVTSVRDNCFTGVTGDAIQYLAATSKYTEAQIRADMPDDMEAVVAGKSVITGWYTAVQFARQRMREIEASYGSMFGASWSRLRYFSTEEAADDSSARVMMALGLDADGAAQLLVNELPGLSSVCTPLLGSPGTIPYGENLNDLHHATCWRLGHQRAMAMDPNAMARRDWELSIPASVTPADRPLFQVD